MVCCETAIDSLKIADCDGKMADDAPKVFFFSFFMKLIFKKIKRHCLTIKNFFEKKKYVDDDAQT